MKRQLKIFRTPSRNNLKILERPPRSVSDILVELKECTLVERGEQLYWEAVHAGLRQSIYAATTLVNLYAKCGRIKQAQEAFERMPCHNVVCWTVLITGYTNNGMADVALNMFWCMKSRGFYPNCRTYVAALGACSSLATREDHRNLDGNLVKLTTLQTAKAIHSDAASNGCDSDVYVENNLIDLYSKCGSVVDACKVFENMKVRSLASWTSFILGRAENGAGLPALELYTRLLLEGILLDARAFVAGIMACCVLAVSEPGSPVDGKLVKLKSLEKGMAVHVQSVCSSHGSDIFVGNSLLDMYAKCGSMEDAARTFHRMPLHDVVSWTTLVLGYVENEENMLALETYGRMQVEGVLPNDRTLVAALKACRGLLDEQTDHRNVKHQVDRIRTKAVEGGYHSDIYVVASLIDLYIKCGNLAAAREVFDGTSSPSIVSWNTMMLGYVESGKPEMALKLFYSRRNRYEPNVQTYFATLIACADLAKFETGNLLHVEICRAGYESQTFLATSLIDFYGKCGSMVQAQQVFDSVSFPDTATWTSMLAGYSRHGDAAAVFHLFERMQREGGGVDAATLLGVLTACSHAGIVDRGRKVFERMVSEYGVTPGVEHFNCMVDMLGRANRLDDALAMVNSMPVSPSVITWRTLLGACGKWNNLDVGKVAFERLVELEEKDAGSYLLMANLWRGFRQDNDDDLSDAET